VALVFTPEERGRLRDALIAAARVDEHISGAALTGSASLGAEDRWSDIDLALGIAPEVEITAVIADWTASMYRDHQAGAPHGCDQRRDHLSRVPASQHPAG
jgi:hypothetical protein